MKNHNKYIDRCLELAKNGLGTTYPNPMVGSVIVHNDTIIGEGWHKKAGEPHAEVLAIESVKDKSLLSQSTIYVSLEPCSHFGKTPPCCNLILQNKIPRVVIATIDSNVKVAGTGIKKLQDAGVEVTLGILEKESKQQNKRFFTFHEKNRPYIILKWAQTADGFLAPLSKTTQKPVWITNEYSRQIVHQWRSEEQAILVGTNTVIDDNPQLDVRNWKGNNPIRIILDPNDRIPPEYSVFDNTQKTIVLTHSKNKINSEKTTYEWINSTKITAQEIATIAYKNQIQSLLVEGGAQTLQTFIDENLWDEARIFIGPQSFIKGIKAPSIDFKNSKKHKIKNDTLLIYKNYDSNYYF